MEGLFSAAWFAALGGILVIDLLMSGDNAIAIALACKNLPPQERSKGMVIGCAGAIFIRVIFTFFAVELLSFPYLQFIGGLLLLYIAVKLLDTDDGEKKIAAPPTLFAAVKTIMVADFIMSMDNILSMASLAHTVPDEKWSLIICGLLLSIPIVLGGAQLLMTIMEKFPVVIYVGSAILAYTAAKMVTGDHAMSSFFQGIHIYVEIIFVVGVIVCGICRKKLAAANSKK